jgi:hypothetical protein
MNPNPNPNTRITRSGGPRHCSYCNNTTHNISTCDAYIESIHQGYLDEYIHSPNPMLFRPYSRNTSMSQLRLLARKIGLPIFNPRIERIEAYLNRIHTHYVHLAHMERQQIRDERNARFLQAHQEAQAEIRRIRRLPESSVSPLREVEGVSAVGSPAATLYYPQYDPLEEGAVLLLPPPLNHISRNREQNWRDISAQNLHDIFEEIHVVANPEPERRKTTVQLHLEPSKFVSNRTSDECPVCYEHAENMVMTKCDHLFCQTCMLQMIRLNCYDLSCALCRSSIKDVYVHSDESMALMFHA